MLCWIYVHHRLFSFSINANVDCMFNLFYGEQIFLLIGRYFRRIIQLVRKISEDPSSSFIAVYIAFSYLGTILFFIVVSSSSSS